MNLSPYNQSIKKTNAYGHTDKRNRLSNDLVKEYDANLPVSDNPFVFSSPHKALKGDENLSLDDWKPSPKKEGPFKRIPSQWRKEANKNFSSFITPTHDDCRKIREYIKMGYAIEEVAKIFKVQSRGIPIIIAKRWVYGLCYAQQPEVINARQKKYLEKMAKEMCGEEE